MTHKGYVLLNSNTSSQSILNNDTDEKCVLVFFCAIATSKFCDVLCHRVLSRDLENTCRSPKAIFSKKYESHNEFY